MTILFKRSYIPRILDGSKTATRRLSRPMVRRGGSYHIRTSFFDYLPEKIEVLELRTQRLGSMTEEDAEKEGFTNLEEFRGEWKAMYGAFDEEAEVWVVEFRFLGGDRKI